MFATARVYLVVEAFASLRRTLAGLYETPEWVVFRRICDGAMEGPLKLHEWSGLRLATCGRMKGSSGQSSHSITQLTY